jgi:ABC-type Fe3+-siderophore transport system permease subunit
VTVSIDEIGGEISLEADSPGRVFLTAAGLVALLALVALLSLTHGAVPVPSGRVAGILVRAIEGRGVDRTQDSLVVIHIRLPRLLLGMMIGAALAMSGALMPGLFRNPLADPGLAGVSAAAGLGAALATVLGDRLPQGLAGLLFGSTGSSFHRRPGRDLDALCRRDARRPHVGCDHAAGRRRACR